MITVTLTNKRHIAAATAAYIADSGPYASPQEYAQASMEQVATSWAETTGVDRIPVSAFT